MTLASKSNLATKYLDPADDVRIFAFIPVTRLSLTLNRSIAAKQNNPGLR
jgi:hypothetical protein